MSRETVNKICNALPSATLEDPWGGGHDAWKIGGKMFASIGTLGGGVALKCASIDEALHLEDMFGWPKAPYFHRSWVFVPLDTSEDELRHRIENSYRTVWLGLSKKLQATLDPFE